MMISSKRKIQQHSSNRVLYLERTRHNSNKSKSRPNTSNGNLENKKMNKNDRRDAIDDGELDSSSLTISAIISDCSNHKIDRLEKRKRLKNSSQSSIHHHQLSFWDEVEADYTCLLSRRDHLFQLFCLWIAQELEEELRSMRNSNNTISINNTMRSQEHLMIYEDGFIQIVNYFLSIIRRSTSYHFLEKMCEFQSLEAFDVLDTKDSGLISKESTFMFLSLLSAKASNSLLNFLALFGRNFFDTLLVAYRTTHKKPNGKTSNRYIQIQAADQLAFLAGIPNYIFNRVLRKLGVSHTEPMSYKTFQEVYQCVFSLDPNESISKRKAYVNQEALVTDTVFITESNELKSEPELENCFEENGSAVRSATSTDDDSKRTHDSPTALEKSQSESEGRMETPTPTDESPKVELPHFRMQRVFSNGNKLNLPLSSNNNTVMPGNCTPESKNNPKWFSSSLTGNGGRRGNEYNRASRNRVENNQEYSPVTAWVDTPSNLDSETDKTMNFVAIKLGRFHRSNKYREETEQKSTNSESASRKVRCGSGPCAVM